MENKYRPYFRLLGKGEKGIRAGKMKNQAPTALSAPAGPDKP
jgi:hypothetical protein